MSIHLFTRPHNYEIQEILGESPLSIVYLAHRFDKDIRWKQLVVIKVFKETSPSLSMLQMESVLRARHCPHLVKALAFEQFQSKPALILEYVSGLSLQQLLKVTSLSPEEIQYICSQTLCGLEELKQNNLCHGDLSWSNILIDTKGQVFLTDYGMANYAGEGLYGTRPFKAPELSQSSPPNFQSDLFSLGVLEKLLQSSLSESQLLCLDHEHFIQAQDPLLDENPLHRTKKTFVFPPCTPAQLSAHIHQAHSQICFNKPATSLPQFLKKKYQWNFRFQSVGLFILAFLLFLLMAKPLVSYKKVQQNAPYLSLSPSPSKVLVRTRKWSHIQLAGYKGYAPIQIPIGRPGTYQLTWKTQAHQGQKYITLKSGQTLLLDDYDLNSSHQAPNKQ